MIAYVKITFYGELKIIHLVVKVVMLWLIFIKLQFKSGFDIVLLPTTINKFY